jgi:hypothetical protein
MVVLLCGWRCVERMKGENTLMCAGLCGDAWREGKVRLHFAQEVDEQPTPT